MPFVSLQCLLAMCLFIQLRRIKAVVLDQDTAQSKKITWKYTFDGRNG